MDGADVEKIQGEDLRSFAESGPSDERQSVIVELGTTDQVRPPAKKELWTSPNDYRAAIEGIEGYSDDGSAMDELQQTLNGLSLPRDPVRLDSAQAFVLDVTPGELRQITASNLVGPIRPNRVLSAPI